MIPERLLDQTVDWVHPAVTTDAYGNTTDDWTGATVTPVKARIDQRTTTENMAGRDQTIAGLVLFTNETGVSAVDRFVVDGWIYEIDGDPWVVHSPAGPHHAEVPLKRVEG